MLHYNRLEADPNAASLKSLYVWEAPVRLWHCRHCLRPPRSGNR